MTLTDGPTERLSPDDMATRREEEFREAALRQQARQAAIARARVVPGICGNCGEPCLWQAAYCDEECRADAEWRDGVAARTSMGPAR